MAVKKRVGFVQEKENKEITPEQSYAEIANEMFDTFKKKNNDYGNSFDKSLDEDGLIASKVRMSDKINRFSTLIKKEKKEVEESLEDTLMDLANYCILTTMWLRKNKIN